MKNKDNSRLNKLLSLLRKNKKHNKKPVKERRKLLNVEKMRKILLPTKKIKRRTNMLMILMMTLTRLKECLKWELIS